MIFHEVNSMDNQNEQIQAPEEGYTPRPSWQVLAARIGLVIFIGLVILQILQIAGIAL